MEANSLSNAVETIVTFLGTSIVGSLSSYVIQKFPEYFLTFLSGINAFTFLVSTYFISFLPNIKPERKKYLPFKKEAIIGFRYILKQSVIRVVLMSKSIFFLATPIALVALKLNHEWFNSSPQILTYSETSFGLGMLLSSIMVSRIKIKRPAPFHIIATMIYGIGVMGFSLCKKAELLVTVNFILGLTISFISVPIYTYVQSIVIDKFQGRVNSALNMLTLGITAFSFAIAGKLLNHFTIEDTFLFMGIGVLISLIPVFLSMDLRKAVFQN